MRNTSLEGGEPRSSHKYPFQLTPTEAELQSAHKRLDMDAEAVYCGKLSKNCDTSRSSPGADLHTVEPKLREAGYKVLFVSTDRPELLYSSLKDPSVSIHYTLLSDPTLQAAQAFHIAFHVDDKIYAEELKYGVDLEKTAGTKLHALPVPSVFIID